MINQSPQLVNSYPPPIQSQKGNSDMMSQRGNRYHGGPRGSHQMNEEGWTTFLTKNVGRGGVNQPLDHSKLRLSKQNMDASDIKLGPCRPTTWSQGAGSGSSSGGSQLQSGSRHSSQESEKSSTSNRFYVFPASYPFVLLFIAILAELEFCLITWITWINVAYYVDGNKHSGPK